MMNTKTYGGWLQVSANLGILAGLILVGFQMRQNTDLLKTQLLYDESNRYIQNEQLMKGENPAEVWAKSIESPSELTLAEQRIVDSIIWTSVEEWRAGYALAKIGLLEDEWKRRIATETGFILGNDYGRAWWKWHSEDNPTDEFNKTVSTVLADRPTHTTEYFAGIMANVNQAKALRDSTQ